MQTELSTLILRPNKVKSVLQYLALVLASGLFVAVAFWMLAEGEFLLGWPILIFFGLGVVFGLFMIFSTVFSDNNYLKLSSEGFEVKMGLKAHATRWDEVTEFFPIDMNNSRFVAYNFTPLYTKMEDVRKLSKNMTGVEAMFMETYGKSVQELTDLLNEWRLRYSESTTKFQLSSRSLASSVKLSDDQLGKARAAFEKKWSKL